MNDALRELNAASVFQLLVRRWHLLLFVPLLTVGAGAAAWQVAPQSYQSRAELLIQSQQTMNPSLRELLYDFSAAKRFPLVESVFLSDTTGERVLRELGVLDEATTPEDIDKAVEDLQRRTEVIGLGGELILVKLTASTPVEAQNTLSVLIDVFTEQILKPQQETVRRSTEYLEQELARLRGATPDVSPTLDPTAGVPNKEALQAEVIRRGSSPQHEIRSALVEAEVRLASIEGEMELLEENRKRRDPNARQLQRDLARARSELARLQHQYTEGHPELAFAQERVRWLQESNQRSGGSDAGRGGRTPASEAKLQELAVAAEGARAEVELLKQRLLTEELSMYEPSNQIWTVQPPTMPRLALKPPLILVLAASLIAGLLLALVWMALSAARDDSMRGQRELAEALRAPSLGSMPLEEA